MNHEHETFDLLVIGGGINGTGIACDAAGRGLSVMLCERGDLASATSSASSKLVHGGLRYLEYYEFGLVRQSLNERSILLDKAPHIVRPMRFVLPHNKTMRPAWMMTAGMFLYDHLGRSDPRLPASERINMKTSPLGAPLGSPEAAGFVYSDCTVDDARLVVLNARDAANRGGVIRTRTALLSASREGAVWQATLHNSASGKDETVRARAIINAAGPWVEELIEAIHGTPAAKKVHLVKGSHIVVPRLYEGDHAYLLQNVDDRVVFVIPYLSLYTLIGTTEVSLDAPPPHNKGGIEITPAETDYLCAAVNLYFDRQLKASDAVWSFAGVRPLFDDEADSSSAITRDYVLDLQTAPAQAPLISVFGGKLTTYRRLAEKVLKRLKPYLGHMKEPWTASSCLPGGDLPPGGIEALVGELAAAHPWIDGEMLRNLVARHGTIARSLLAGVTGVSALGQDFGHGLYGREVDYMVSQEWAQTTEDILWRRTKLGLVFDEPERARLNDYLKL